MWHDFLGKAEFSLGLWGSQRLCFAAVFHAYEAFLTQCMEMTKKGEQYHPRLPQLKDDLNDLRENLGDQCLQGDTFDVARLVRNALAHNGGKLTQELRRVDHGFNVSPDGRIHVFPENVCSLFDLLKNRVENFVTRIKDLPAFEPVELEITP